MTPINDKGTVASTTFPKNFVKLRSALVEIVGGELKIYPIASNDAEERIILDALRFLRGDFAQ
jgi:hypothetical protein